MQALIASGVIGLHLFWNSAVNKCVLVSNSGGFVHAGSYCSTVQLFNVTVSFVHVVYTHFQDKIMRTPATENFSHAFQSKRLSHLSKKVA
jgi:hypothetical protein